MEVRADSKGRLTGAEPGETYRRQEDGNGTITFVPAVPKFFDTERSVSHELFEEFFGVPASAICRDSIRPAYYYEDTEGHLPSGLVAKKFVLTSDGKRVYDGQQEPMTETIFIKIRRPEK